MTRDLKAMAAKTYDLLVVGGGITGACIVRDAALRGVSAALVEKGDFSHATSAATSKLIHGGLRYLYNREFKVVWTSLRERRIWSDIAPHMVDPLTFLIPTAGFGIRGRAAVGTGLTVYDWLAYSRNPMTDPDKTIPSHKHLSRREALALEPGLECIRPTGAMVYYDRQMYSPERLTLECILQAATHGADVANYVEVIKFIKEGNTITGARVRDVGSDRGEFEIKARMTANAAGPWADILMGLLQNGNPSRRLIRSKGIHLITRSLTDNHALGIITGREPFFILPWRGYSIVGTTDTVYEGDPDKVGVTERDINDFLDIVNEGYPRAKLDPSDVLYAYGGLRPIVDRETKFARRAARKEDSRFASRAAEVYDHETHDGLKGVVSAIGGKWTTSRQVAEQVLDLAVAKLGVTAKPCVTDRTPTHGGRVGRFAEFLGRAVARYNTISAAVIENLAKNYGSRMDDVLALTRDDPKLAEQISDRFPDIAAQVVHAARHEMALTLEDVLFRRTGLGTAGTPGDAAMTKVAAIMARELDWDRAERAAQVDRARAKFASWAASSAKDR
jgi:glycerol-3-phosphate dehydrogenase